MKRLIFALLSSATIVAVAFVGTSRAATLVAHYQFDGADLGTDSSGFGNHAINNGAFQDAGWLGGGAAFNGSSTIVKSGGLAGYSQTTGYTHAAWVKLDPAANGFDGIISQDPGSCCQNRFLLHPDHRPYINVSEHNDRHLAGATPLPFDEWTHIAITAESFGEAHVYLNGIEAVGSPQSFPALDNATSWNTYLGAGEAGTAHLFNGVLDDVRIFEGVLSQEEIQGLMIAIPEPSTFLLCVVGLASLGLFSRRRRAAVSR